MAVKRSRRAKVANLLIQQLPDVVWYRLPQRVKMAVLRALWT